MTTVLRPMRETVRRRKVKTAMAAGEQQAAQQIAALLDRRFKILKRELRRANLRKRLYKAQRDTGDLTKALGVDWRQWIDDLATGIKQALGGIARGVQDVEAQYWLNRGKHLDPVDAQDVIAAYEIRTGRQITGIGEDTRDRVLTAISDWYNTDDDLPSLINQLGQYFSPERAALIARTESAYIASQVTQDAMAKFGIRKWNFDLAADKGQWPCQTCIDYAARNPHEMTDPFPPLHPGDRCGVSYVMED